MLVRAQAVVSVHFAQLDHAKAAAQADEGVTTSELARSRISGQSACTSSASGAGATVVVNAETGVDLENSFQAATEVFSAADDETRRAVSNAETIAIGTSSTIGIFGLCNAAFDDAGQGNGRLSESAASNCECSQSN